MILIINFIKFKYRSYIFSACLASKLRDVIFVKYAPDFTEWEKSEIAYLYFI